VQYQASWLDRQQLAVIKQSINNVNMTDYTQEITAGDAFAFTVTINDDDPDIDFTGAALHLSIKHGSCDFSYDFTPQTISTAGVPQVLLFSVAGSVTADWPCGLLAGQARFYRESPIVGPLTVANVRIVVRETNTEIS